MTLPCLHEMFEAQVGRTPHAVAVACDDHCVTYGELDRRANDLAVRLVGAGVGIESLVGLCVERSPEMLIGMLGILKAGAAYVPIDPSYPRERIDYILDDAQVAAVVTQRHLLESLPASSRCVEVDATEAGSPSSGLRPHRRAVPANLAYVIYTSGSTGKPKGVMVAHESVGNVIGHLQERYSLSAADRLVQIISFSFDGSVCDFYWPLSVGARIVMLRPDVSRDPRHVVDVAEATGATVMIVVPSMLSALVDEWRRREASPKLRRVFSGGEVLTAGMTEQFFKVVQGKVKLTNLYGPTETTVFSSAWDCEDNATSESQPIGHPISATELEIEVLAHGVEYPQGELCISGLGVARGYLRRPRLTAECFVPRPRGLAGARMYRTGDIVRRRGDGPFEYIGRSDSQVKVRGFRIELAEVEFVLASLPSVREAAVIVRDGDLAAFVVIAGELAIDILVSSLRARLPEAMVPAHIHCLDRLPVGAHGKVDRRLLETIPLNSIRDPVEPDAASLLERMVGRVIADGLGVGAIGPDDPYFAMGMTSLQAVRIAQRLEDVLRIDVPLSAIFLNTNVAGLVAALAPHAELRAELEHSAACVDTVLRSRDGSGHE